MPDSQLAGEGNEYIFTFYSLQKQKRFLMTLLNFRSYICYIGNLTLFFRYHPVYTKKACYHKVPFCIRTCVWFKTQLLSRVFRRLRIKWSASWTCTSFVVCSDCSLFSVQSSLDSPYLWIFANGPKTNISFSFSKFWSVLFVLNR